MENLQRRASGIYVTRLTIPVYLRRFVGLERDDPELGTRLVPSPTRMPDSAIAHFASGVYAVPGESVAAVADSLLVSGEADVVMFAAPGGDRSQGFVPDDSVTMTLANVEVSTSDLQRLRQTIAANIEPERVAAARAAQKATTGVLGVCGRKKSSQACFRGSGRLRDEFSSAKDYFAERDRAGQVRHSAIHRI